MTVNTMSGIYFSKTYRLLLLGGILALLSQGIAFAGEVADGTLERFYFEQPLMGTNVSVVVYAPDEASANTAAEAAFRRMESLVLVLSDYDPESEVRRLCANSRPGHPVTVSDELWFVLNRSVAVSELTDGAFDVTIGPCVALWRDARRRHRLPLPEQLARARERVGWELLRMDACRHTVELLQPEMQIDLGGIAKGYIADEGLAVLKEHGIEQAMIDAGGDIVCGKAPPGTEGWRIGIAPLEDPDGAPSRFLILEDASVATSGDAYRFFEIDGVRYSHLIDPATCLGVTISSSVTVVAEDGITADALASAVSVLGPERGLELVSGLSKIEAHVVTLDRANEQPIAVETPGFEGLTDSTH